MLVDALLAEDGEALAGATGPALAALGDPGVFDLLAAKAADPSPRVRRLVAAALGGTGGPAARPGLESLLGAAEPAVRLEAALGLGNLGLAAAAPALLGRFRPAAGAAPEADAVVRRALAWALARCDAPEAWAALEEAAREDADPAFRRYAAGVLANPRRGFVK